MNKKQYDSWKLSYPDNWDKENYQCETSLYVTGDSIDVEQFIKEVENLASQYGVNCEER